MSWELQALLRDPGLSAVTGSTPHSNVRNASSILAFHSICKGSHQNNARGARRPRGDKTKVYAKQNIRPEKAEGSFKV